MIDENNYKRALSNIESKSEITLEGLEKKKKTIKRRKTDTMIWRLSVLTLPLRKIIHVILQKSEMLYWRMMQSCLSLRAQFSQALQNSYARRQVNTLCLAPSIMVAPHIVIIMILTLPFLVGLRLTV